MSHGPDCDRGGLRRIDNGERKSPKEESPGVVLAYRPALRGCRDCVGGAAQFLDEIQGGLTAALPIPGNRTLNIRDCTLG